jgi:hypothetical protein
MRTGSCRLSRPRRTTCRTWDVALLDNPERHALAGMSLRTPVKGDLDRIAMSSDGSTQVTFSAWRVVPPTWVGRHDAAATAVSPGEKAAFASPAMGPVTSSPSIPAATASRSASGPSVAARRCDRAVLYPSGRVARRTHRARRSPSSRSPRRHSDKDAVACAAVEAGEVARTCRSARRRRPRVRRPRPRPSWPRARASRCGRAAGANEPRSAECA